MDSTTLFIPVLFVTFLEYYVSPFGFALFTTLHILLLQLEITGNHRYGLKTSVI
jgi:hypothetical protein